MKLRKTQASKIQPHWEWSCSWRELNTKLILTSLTNIPVRASTGSKPNDKSMDLVHKRTSNHEELKSRFLTSKIFLNIWSIQRTEVSFQHSPLRMHQILQTESAKNITTYTLKSQMKKKKLFNYRKRWWKSWKNRGVVATHINKILFRNWRPSINCSKNCSVPGARMEHQSNKMSMWPDIRMAIIFF